MTSPDHNPPLRLLVAYQQLYPEQPPEHIVQAPGRDMWVAANIDDTDTFTIHVPDLDARTTFNWRSAKFKRTVLNRPLPSWARYPAGVIFTLCAMGLDVTGVDAVLVGEEPPGPRYDYALGMAVAALWYTLHSRPYTAETLLEIIEQVRRQYVEI